MKKPRRSRAFRRLAQALRQSHPPISADQLAELWVSKNFDPLAEIALRSLREATGTQYCVEPLHFVVFESEEIREAYWAHLRTEAKRRDPKYSLDERLCLHVSALTDWCRAEMGQALKGLAVHGTFKEIA
jgi:hypothetical protein